MYMSPYAFCGEFDRELDIQKLQKPRVKMFIGWLSRYKQDRITEHRTLSEGFTIGSAVLEFKRAEVQWIQISSTNKQQPKAAVRSSSLRFKKSLSAPMAALRITNITSKTRWRRHAVHCVTAQLWALQLQGHISTPRGKRTEARLSHFCLHSFHTCAH
jgi:hypothetical protein